MWRPVFCHADGLLSPRRVIVTPDEISAFIRRFLVERCGVRLVLLNNTNNTICLDNTQ